MSLDGVALLCPSVAARPGKLLTARNNCYVQDVVGGAFRIVTPQLSTLTLLVRMILRLLALY